jgi:hypothetical protein
VTGRLSAVGGRRRVETSAGFFELSLAMGFRSPVEGRCAPAEEGLLRPVALLFSVGPSSSGLWHSAFGADEHCLL